MWRILEALGNPQDRLPPVIHIAGTNGKGSTLAILRAAMEKAGLCVHTYTSPHLVRFHERIGLAGTLIAEEKLSSVLEECEQANGEAPITFFEITTAAAFLEFSRVPADYVLLETGLGGRLDATNVVKRPAATAITAIDYDHQQYLGETLTEIAREKAGIMRKGVPCIIAPQSAEAFVALVSEAERLGSADFIGSSDWHAYEQMGRLVYQDVDGLLDLPLPALHGRHQIDNAGTAIAVLRKLGDARISETHISDGLKSVTWPARLQRLNSGNLNSLLPAGAELWLDGGHNPSAGKALAAAFSEINERHSKPLVLIWGMLNTKDAGQFIAPFAGLAERVLTLAIPGEENALSAESLAGTGAARGLACEAADSLPDALRRAGNSSATPRVLICGSLYLAGHVLAAQMGEEMSRVSGVSRR
ncbi:MAG: bifunctional folylpolyglutamate synthase/dihydrofolate synthase [Rhizobiales bacterium]|nr:bifunctional folylpolyglutamate synthase/dihydrofolate synthase [Hyphomicrobiales bacterium]